jgi:hypothetical protein
VAVILYVSLHNELNVFLDSLAGNKGLCGMPPLPECPLFWENGGLSTKGKIAIGLSCLLVVCVLLLVIYMLCIRRGRHDYDFALPQDLICKLKSSSNLSIISPCSSRFHFCICLEIP